MDLKRRKLEVEEQKYLGKMLRLSFFRSYGRNWGKICFCNAILLLTNILSMLIGLCIVMFLFPMIFPFFSLDHLGDYLVSAGMVAAENITTENINNVFMMMCMVSSMLLMGFMLVINGPVQAAVCYYFKNIIVDDADFKKDFKQGLKDNWKKSLLASVISIVVVIVLIFNTGFYQNMGKGYVPMITRGFFACLIIFWSSVQIYLYPLIATVELSFKEAYKNAVILSIVNLPQTMLIILVEFLLFLIIPFVFLLSFGSIGYAITMLLYILFSYGFIAFLSMFRTWKAIQKWISSDS